MAGDVQKFNRFVAIHTPLTQKILSKSVPSSWSYPAVRTYRQTASTEYPRQSEHSQT